jgi:hypothetical protein
MNIIVNGTKKTKKIKNYFSMMKDEHVQYVYSLLFGMLGSLIILMIFMFFQKPSLNVGTVNITGLVDRFIKEEAKKNLSPDLMRNEVKEFGEKMEFVLSNYSKQKNIIFFPSEAVIAGSHDYTSTIINTINDTYVGNHYEKNK